jgi:hypothetical protein
MRLVGRQQLLGKSKGLLTDNRRDRLRSSAETLDILERQRILRLLVKEVWSATGSARSRNAR